MLKNSHLGVSKFGFLSLYPFCTENANFTTNSKITPFSKRRGFSFGIKGKIDIPLEFFIRNEQSERKSNFDIRK
jgi:hypothetical protein